MFSLVFLVLLSFYLYLGFVFWKHKSIKAFILWTVLLPLTPALTLLHTKFQINVYYGFVVAPGLLFILNQLKRGGIAKTVLLMIIGVSALMLFYIPYGLFQNTVGISTINILKDIKPLFFLVVGIIFLELLKDRQLAWNGPFAKRLLKLNFYFTLLFFVLITQTSLIGYISNDAFYKAMESRYLSMGTLFAVFYFIAQLAANKKIKGIELLYIFIPIFLSGNRTLFIVLAVVFCISTILSMNNVQLFLKRISLILGGIVLLFGGILNLNSALRERVFSLFNVQKLLAELSEKRFAPFFEQLGSFEWFNYLLGKGIGEPFFIPWFVYRENIDNYNIYMDNLYLTLYVKYGIGMFFVLFLLFHLINKTQTNKKFKILSISYFLIIGLTTSFMYQNSFLFILLLLVGFRTQLTPFPKAQASDSLPKVNPASHK